jgi:hypothetical protein
MGCLFHELLSRAPSTRPRSDQRLRRVQGRPTVAEEQSPSAQKAEHRAAREVLPRVETERSAEPQRGFCLRLRSRPVAVAVDPPRLQAFLQAPGFRGDASVFRLRATGEARSRLEPALRRNAAARLPSLEAADNPEVAGSNPAPATEEAPETGLFRAPRMELAAGTFAQFCPRSPKPGSAARANVCTSVCRVRRSVLY